MLARTIVRAAIVWVSIAVAAVINGILRVELLIPALGATAGLVTSGLLLAVEILLITYFTLAWIGVYTQRSRWMLGIGWLLATLAFEFSMGYSQGKPLDQMLAPYMFEGGNLWPVVLFVTLTSPWIVGRMRPRSLRVYLRER